ncbi:MAG TPA: substrate-binding domain-containing protein [Chthoniobacterales bacterium]
MSDESSPSLSLLEKAFARPTDGQLPLHAKVHRGLRYAIENFFEDGQRFFTEKELIDNLKVSQVTVRRAVYDLVREGLLERRVAKGSFVRKRPGGNSSTFEVAVHLADWDSSFLSQILREVLGSCGSKGYSPKVFYSRQSGTMLSQEGSSWNHADPSAAILIATPTDLASELCRRYESSGKPVVAIDNRAPSETAHFVGTDNLATTRLGLDHLTQLGHRRICLLLNEPEAHENVRLREKYFKEECRQRNLSGWHVVHCGTRFWENSYTKAYEIMPKVMALDPAPTAIFAFDDAGAWAVLKWCSLNNVKVPEQLSVLGFANDKPSAFVHPSLTTIAHPIVELASTAVDLLTLTPPTRQIQLLKPSLVVRESTGPSVTAK